MYRRILIPLDGSPLAEQTLPFAKMLAARFSSSVILFRAIEPVHEAFRDGDKVVSVADQVETLRGIAQEYLETACRDFTAAGIAAESIVRIGSPATAILEGAEKAQADLIAMATHGRTGLQRWRYGSVADKVLTGSRLPLLLVRAQAAPPPPAIARILVPLDGSELAEQALPLAQDLAKSFNAEILLLRVWAPSAYIIEGFPAGRSSVDFDEAARSAVQDYLRSKSLELQDQGTRVQWVTNTGLVADAILDTADKQAANVIVMSTHGRSGMGRWVMGSIAERVLSASVQPVLLIRSGTET